MNQQQHEAFTNDATSAAVAGTLWIVLMIVPAAWVGVLFRTLIGAWAAWNVWRLIRQSKWTKTE